MAEYNAPFFNALAVVFLECKKRHGEEKALQFMRSVFSQRLGPVYDEWGFQRGNPRDFKKVVGKNDQLFGLQVELEVEKTRLSTVF